MAANNRNKGHPGTTTVKQKNSDPRMKGPVKWQRNTCWLAKKWVIISDQIARTECEMAFFVLKKNVEQKGPSEEMGKSVKFFKTKQSTYVYWHFEICQTLESVCNFSFLTGFVLLTLEKIKKKSLIRGAGSDMGYQT